MQRWGKINEKTFRDPKPKFKTPNNQNRVETMSNVNKIYCFQFEYLSKCVSRLDSGKLFYLPYPACKNSL